MIINVGDVLVKDGWTQCAVEVIDKGKIYFVGELYDYKENKVIGQVIGEMANKEWLKAEIMPPIDIVAGVN